MGPVPRAMVGFMVAGEHFCQGAVAHCVDDSSVGSLVVKSNRRETGATTRLLSTNWRPGTARNHW